MLSLLTHRLTRLQLRLSRQTVNTIELFSILLFTQQTCLFYRILSIISSLRWFLLRHWVFMSLWNVFWWWWKVWCKSEPYFWGCRDRSRFLRRSLFNIVRYLFLTSIFRMRKIFFRLDHPKMMNRLIYSLWSQQSSRLRFYFQRYRSFCTLSDSRRNEDICDRLLNRFLGRLIERLYNWCSIDNIFWVWMWLFFNCFLRWRISLAYVFHIQVF